LADAPTAALAMSRLLKFRGLYPSAPAWDKVCLACWPRAQGWLCVGIGFWIQRWLRAAVFRHWPLAVRVASFSAVGRVSVLALGRVSVWVSLDGGIGLWPCFSPDKPARWRKTKHPTFEAFTKAKNCFQ